MLNAIKANLEHEFSFENKFNTISEFEESFDLIKDAEFPGGTEGMSKFLRSNMVYPEEALDALIGGKVYISFSILTDGSISDVRISRGVEDCRECEVEVLRLVKTFPKWEPATNNGVPVKQWFNLPIKFNPG